MNEKINIAIQDLRKKKESSGRERRKRWDWKKGILGKLYLNWFGVKKWNLGLLSLKILKCENPEDSLIVV